MYTIKCKHVVYLVVSEGWQTIIYIYMVSIGYWHIIYYILNSLQLFYMKKVLSERVDKFFNPTICVMHSFDN